MSSKVKKCHICGTKKGNRFCLREMYLICSLCCGTTRSESICPRECEYFEKMYDVKPSFQFASMTLVTGDISRHAIEEEYLPNLFDYVHARVPSFYIKIIDSHTLLCAINLKFESQNVIAENIYATDSWKKDMPDKPEIESKNLVPQFVIFLPRESNLSRNKIALTSKKGHIPFECEYRRWYIHLPGAYPRFAPRPIPSEREFKLFYGKNIIIFTEFDLSQELHLEFVIENSYQRYDKDRHLLFHGFGILLPFSNVVFDKITFDSDPKIKLLGNKIDMLFPQLTKHIPQQLMTPLKEEKAQYKVIHGESERICSNEKVVKKIKNTNYGTLSFNMSLRPPEDVAYSVRAIEDPIPTGIYHLIKRIETVHAPLVKIGIINFLGDSINIKISSEIQGYSEREVEDIILKPGDGREIYQMPTLKDEVVNSLSEVKDASLLVSITKDSKLMFEKTFPVTLLSRDTMLWDVSNLHLGIDQDLSEFVTAWITPHVRDPTTKKPLIDELISSALSYNSRKEFVGYQIIDDTEPKLIVREQVKAIYDYVSDSFSYVSKALTLGHTSQQRTQRICLPKDVIVTKAGNCIDLAVLFASALETLELNPSILLSTDHALIGWETWYNSNEFEFLECTYIGRKSFEEALEEGKRKSSNWLENKRYPEVKNIQIKKCRENGIIPME